MDTSRGWRPESYEGPETASDLAKRTGNGPPITRIRRFALWYTGPGERTLFEPLTWSMPSAREGRSGRATDLRVRKSTCAPD
jgi:hypothetical protein